METTENQKTSMSEYLEMDGSMIFNIALFNRFSSIGDSCYREICGGFIEGAIQWATHNIYGIDESANAKYTGWTIHFENGATRRVYIENWVMNSDIKDWGHAKNLFNKYLKVKA
jgi:hypothetical protein